MKIRVEEKIFEGTPTEIIAEFHDENFFHDEFPTIGDYIRYEQSLFVQLTGLPCPLPDGTDDERALALIRNLADIDAVEVLEDA